MPSLILLLENCERHVYPLGKATLIVGRADSSDIHLPHEIVSNNHASIIFTDGHFYVRDNGSANGTCINGERVSRQMLQHYDIMKFGEYRFLVDLKDEVPLPSQISEKPMISNFSEDKKHTAYALPQGQKKLTQKLNKKATNSQSKIIVSRPIPISKVIADKTPKASLLRKGEIWRLLDKK
jgi:pSer/pThr/pTyr-binding forkhead associated (FHA) protein